MTVLGLFQSGKVRLRRTIDQGNLIKLIGVWYKKFVLITRETLLDGDARSVRYGGILRDQSGQPDEINFQEVADSANFVMGSDAAEFVNKVNDQVRKRQKRISNVAGSGRRTFNNLGNVYGCDDECSDIHGKEFPGQSKFHFEYNRSHLEENVRHICKNWSANKMKSSMWIRFIGKKHFMETSVIDW